MAIVSEGPAPGPDHPVRGKVVEEKEEEEELVGGGVRE